MLLHTQSSGRGKTLHNIPGMIAAAVFAAGIPIPFVSFRVRFELLDETMKFSRLLTDSTADWVVLSVLAAICLLLAWLNHNKLLITMGIILTWITVAAGRYFSDVEQDVVIRKDIGYFCCLLGAVGLIGSGIFGIIRNRRHRLQDAGQPPETALPETIPPEENDLT